MKHHRKQCPHCWAKLLYEPTFFSPFDLQKPRSKRNPCMHLTIRTFVFCFVPLLSPLADNGPALKVKLQTCQRAKTCDRAFLRNLKKQPSELRRKKRERMKEEESSFLPTWPGCLKGTASQGSREWQSHNGNTMETLLPQRQPSPLTGFFIPLLPLPGDSMGQACSAEPQ